MNLYLQETRWAPIVRVVLRDKKQIHSGWTTGVSKCLKSKKKKDQLIHLSIYKTKKSTTLQKIQKDRGINSPMFRVTSQSYARTCFQVYLSMRYVFFNWFANCKISQPVNYVKSMITLKTEEYLCSIHALYISTYPIPVIDVHFRRAEVAWPASLGACRWIILQLSCLWWQYLFNHTFPNHQ